MFESHFPSNAVVIRFGTNTPFYLLTLSYGIFYDPSLRKHFTSLDAYIGYHMLVRNQDRQDVMRAPNGYIAHLNLLDVFEHNPNEDLIAPNWEQDRREILLTGLRLKYSQSSCMTEVLTRTRDRPIFDASRWEDTYFGIGDGTGLNMHGQLLEQVRTELLSGELA